MIERVARVLLDPWETGADCPCGTVFAFDVRNAQVGVAPEWLSSNGYGNWGLAPTCPSCGRPVRLTVAVHEATCKVFRGEVTP